MTHRLQYEGTKHGLQNVIMGIIKNYLQDALLFLEESFYFVGILLNTDMIMMAMYFLH